MSAGGVTPDNQAAAAGMGIDANQLSSEYKTFVSHMSSSWQGTMPSSQVINDALTAMNSDPALKGQIQGLLADLNKQLTPGAISPGNVPPVAQGDASASMDVLNDVIKLEGTIYPEMASVQNAIGKATPFLPIAGQIPASSPLNAQQTATLQTAVNTLQSLQSQCQALDPTQIPADVRDQIFSAIQTINSLVPSSS